MVPPFSCSSRQDHPDSIGRSHLLCLELFCLGKSNTLNKFVPQKCLKGPSATCRLALLGHAWSPCLCYSSYGNGSQGLWSGYSVLALFQGPFRHDCRVHPVTPVHLGQNGESETVVGALCCPHNCHMGPWEKSRQLVQGRLVLCLAGTGYVVCVCVNCSSFFREIKLRPTHNWNPRDDAIQAFQIWPSSDSLARHTILWKCVSRNVERNETIFIK